ncbi:DoxX family membrane protein [Rhodoblastus sp.]|uniref:DoxX family membrane protein n=1 Tax=Rhodoblastus sp. TaxID=1962975 RepID=UPI003F997E7D
MWVILAAFLARLFLVLLFLPFSALDKLLNFDLAVGQAEQEETSPALAKLLILGGFGVETFMSLGVLTGVADRFCAFVLALYCVVTALLWKQFWRRPDFRLVGLSQGRELFWDFLKNLAVAGGFLMLALGPTATSAQKFFDAPFASQHPYRVTGDAP